MIDMKLAVVKFKNDGYIIVEPGVIFSDDEDEVLDCFEDGGDTESESDSADVEWRFTTTRSGRIATTHYRSSFE